MSASQQPLPALNNGQPGYVGHELAATAPAHPLHLLWDVALPLVAAIALPFVLKYALESELFARFFRFSPATPKSPSAVPEEENFDDD